VQLTNLKGRIKRLEWLARVLAREVQRQREPDGLLLVGERRQYLRGIKDALAGAEVGRVVLAAVVKRMACR
jgi:hypothetical protein